MAWATPHSWVPGETATAAQLNQDLRDNELYLFSGRPTLAISNGTVGVSGGTGVIASVSTQSDVIYTTDSGLDCWDQNWGFTPSGSLVVVPQVDYYWLHAWVAQTDSVVAAQSIGTISVGAISPANGGDSFGFLMDLAPLRVTVAGFSYVKNGPSDQMLADFHVKVV